MKKKKEIRVDFAAVLQAAKHVAAVCNSTQAQQASIASVGRRHRQTASLNGQKPVVTQNIQHCVSTSLSLGSNPEPGLSS